MQLYRDTEVPILKAKEFAPYPVRAVLLNFTISLRRYKIDYGFILIACMRVGTSVFIEEGNVEKGGNWNRETDIHPLHALSLDELNPATFPSTGRDHRMEILRNSLRHVLKPLFTASVGFYQLKPITKLFEYLYVL